MKQSLPFAQDHADLGRSDFLSHSTFKHLIVHINSMRASSPKPVGRPTQTFVRGAEKLDVDLIAAVMITNL